MKTVSIILVRPQIGENIGAAARAMWNFGFNRLKIVAPRDGWPSIEAERNSAGALESSVKVDVFDTLQDAIKEDHYVYATTARPRDLVKPVVNPQEAAKAIALSELSKLPEETQSHKTAMVFGAERTGLTNDELSLCHTIVTIPTNPYFSSLNLAQSVLLLCWEMARAREPEEEYAPLHLPTKNSDFATQEELENFFSRLETELDNGDFFKAPDLRPTMMRNIRTLFMRAEPTDQELRTLHGIISALKKAGPA